MWLLHQLEHSLHEHVANTTSALRRFTNSHTQYFRNSFPWENLIPLKVRQTQESTILTHCICILLLTEYLLTDTFLNS